MMLSPGRSRWTSLSALLLILSSLQLSPPLRAQDARTTEQGATRDKAFAALVDILVRAERSSEKVKVVQSAYDFDGLCKVLAGFAKSSVELAKQIDAALGAEKGADAEEPKALSTAEAQDAIVGVFAAKDADAAKQRLLSNPAVAKRVLKAVRTRVANLRRGQFLGYMNAQLRTGARYVGQYQRARVIGEDILDIACDILDSTQVTDPAMRATLVIAMRDFVKEPPITKAQKARIVAYVEDEFEDLPVIQAAIGLLAYAGHDEHYAKRVAALEKRAADASPADSLEVFSELAELQSIAEKNDQASASYAKLIAVAEKAGLQKRALASHHYNHACALEKAGKRDEAVAALDKALTLDKESLARATVWIDRDIAEIRKTKAFDELVKKHGIVDPRERAKTDKQGGQKAEEKGGGDSE